MDYIRLIFAACLPIGFSLMLYLMEKKTSFGQLSALRKQIVTGLLFGVLACFSTMFSVEVGGAATNVRDATPLCAGLIFGAPAGVIAGVVGGIFRWLATPLLNIGAYTRIGCSIATVIAGVVGALLRKFMFDNKRPAWFYGLATGIAMEVLHMLLIFLTNMDDLTYAFTFITKCAPIMIVMNAFTVALAILLVSCFDKDEQRISRRIRTLSISFQRLLLVVVISFFIISSIFTAIVQKNVAVSSADELLRLSLKDIETEIHDASDANLLNITHRIAARVDASDGAYDLNAIADEYDVSEISIIDKFGIIVESTDSSFVGFNMASGDQSAEFLVILRGNASYVQSYQPISIDSSQYRKYAGVVLQKGGFVQVGYGAEQFQKDIASVVNSSTANRHLESEGCIIIADQSGKIVSDLADHAGGYLKNAGLDSIASYNQGERFLATVHGKPCYTMYTMSEGYYIIASIPEEEVLLSGNIALYVTIFMEIVIFTILFISIFLLIKKLVVDNILDINHSLAQITEGNLDVQVNVRSNYEFASLSDDINTTVSKLKDYIAEAAARIDSELEFAKTIQVSALPGVFPPFPGRDEFDIYARMDTAKEVGGDFYDFYFVDKDVIAILIADVSGKGIPAAMFMMTAKTVIKSYAQSGLSPDEVFTKANAKLCEGNEAEMFVTAWMAYVNVKTGHVSFVNAGHNPPLIRHKDGSFEYLRVKAGFVLAGMEGMKYQLNEMDIEQGDEIFLYTDGITEATDKNNELYGEDRLVQYLNSLGMLSAEATCFGVKANVDAFVGDAPQFDDMTMLSFKMYKPEQITKEYNTDSASENVEAITDFIDAELHSFGCSPKAQAQIDVAVDEIFSNISKFAYAPFTGPTTITISIDPGTMMATIRFIDSGHPYNPLLADDPDLSTVADEDKIGGLGVFLVKKTMDDVTYENRDDQNILTITKKIL